MSKCQDVKNYALYDLDAQCFLLWGVICKIVASLSAFCNNTSTEIPWIFFDCKKFENTSFLNFLSPGDFWSHLVGLCCAKVLFKEIFFMIELPQFLVCVTICFERYWEWGLKAKTVLGKLRFGVTELGWVVFPQKIGIFSKNENWWILIMDIHLWGVKKSIDLTNKKNFLLSCNCMCVCTS